MSSIKAIAIAKAVGGGIPFIADDGMSSIKAIALAKAIGGGKPSIADATITVGADKTYTGQQQTQSVTVVYDGTTLTENTDYTVTGNTGTNAGNYTLTVTGMGDYGGSVNKPWAIAKAQGTLSVSPSSVSISGVSETATSTITKTGDGAVSVGTSDSGVATASVSGDTVTVTSVGEGSATITITMADGSNYLGTTATIAATVSLAPSVNVFGVMWDYSDPSTTLTRLTPATDPYGYVTATVSTEPSPAIGDGEGSSPFDSYMPWAGMDEYNIIDGAVSYRKGDAGFSRSDYDTMVYIPTFYSKIIKNTDTTKMYFYAADGAIEGFDLHPGSNSYIGRYHTGNYIGTYKSITGIKAETNKTRSVFRTNSHNKGSNWWQWGVAQWMAVQLLYLIEFADWNSQSKIGNGRAYSSGTAQNSGGTDSMVYHTGRASGTEDEQPVQYRHIENIWGNYYNWLDGLNFNNRAAYVCTDPSKFEDATSTNYTAAGLTLPSSGYITDMGVSSALPWLILPTVASSGSETTYVTDYVASNTNWRTSRVAGAYNLSNSGYCGMFCLYGTGTTTLADTTTGSRLMFVP